MVSRVAIAPSRRSRHVRCGSESARNSATQQTVGKCQEET